MFAPLNVLIPFQNALSDPPSLSSKYDPHVLRAVPFLNHFVRQNVNQKQARRTRVAIQGFKVFEVQKDGVSDGDEILITN